jgi:hypothetical protein
MVSAYVLPAPACRFGTLAAGIGWASARLRRCAVEFFLRESKTFFTHLQLHLTLGAFGFGIGMTASLPFSVGDYPQPQLESQVKLLYSNRCSTQVLVPELPDITTHI